MATPIGQIDFIALHLPIPADSDEFFRAPSDAADHHESAYVRACTYGDAREETRVAWLWKHAMEIGLRAGVIAPSEFGRRQITLFKK